MDTPVTNIPEYSVGELAGAVKRTLEGAFGRVRVRGEVSAVKRYPSGHIYLSLKDEAGTLNAIVWKSAVPRIGLKPEDGVEVIATGRISAWGDKSQYQLIIERLEYAGAGAMLARIEALKVKLAAEGLFERRRPLPMLPALIGVVTSAQGAVLHDIWTTIARRFGRPILLWPVPVQGDGAAEKIAAAITGFSSLPRDGIARPDVLIVARGGGSLEDLMAFNDEAVVRAAAACSIPLISAVGHETDHTLIDLAADRRAPTPTAAAELAVPPRLELLADLGQRGARLAGGLARMQQERRHRLAAAAGRLPDVTALADGARQRLDDRTHRLALALPNLLAARRGALTRAERGLTDPRTLLARATGRLGAVPPLPSPRALLLPRAAALSITATALATGLRHATQHRLHAAARTLARFTPAPIQARLREATSHLRGAAAQLEAVNPRAVLARGYALVFDPAGHPVGSAEAARKASRLRIEFADGTIAVRADPAVRQGVLPL